MLSLRRCCLGLLGCLALLWLLTTPLETPVPLGRANSSLCLRWLEPCPLWEVCPAEPGGGRLRARTPPQCAARQLRHALIVHEQHPQELGCDRRLLAIVQLLQAQGLTVSLLYRKHVPASMQSPPTAELAEMLGASPPRTWR